MPEKQKKKPRGRPFPKGVPRHPRAGRKAGTPNRVTRAVKEFLMDLTSDTKVQEAVRGQIIAGDRGSMQAFLGAVAHVIGKPKETHELGVTPKLARLILAAQESLKAGTAAPRTEKTSTSTPG